MKSLFLAVIVAIFASGATAQVQGCSEIFYASSSWDSPCDHCAIGEMFVLNNDGPVCDPSTDCCSGYCCPVDG